MAYDEMLAQRVRDCLDGQSGVSERRMFGGLCFMLHGNMCCGLVKDELMVRVGPDAYASLLAKPHARPMDFTGKPLKGMLYVAAKGLKTKRGLSAWVDRAAAFAGALPRKKAAPKLTLARKKTAKHKTAKKQTANKTLAKKKVSKKKSASRR